MELLEKLIEVKGASGDESRIKEFVKNYVLQNQDNWKVKPVIVDGEEWQDVMILVFGKPKTAIYAHLDSIGYTVGYSRELIKIGGPAAIDGMLLVGTDEFGKEIEVELNVFEDENGGAHYEYLGESDLQRGTQLTFKPNFRETDDFVQTPYLDNRLGVWASLQVAKTLENGAIVFSTYEEHGGNTVGYAAQYLWENYKVRQALISDITWVTDGVQHKNGVAISLRDSSVPRKTYIDRIVKLAKESGAKFQLEVEKSGGSDGSMLQKSSVMVDWCFIGAPEDNVHTPDEKVAKEDIMNMVELYKYLMSHL
ncbi:MAG: putative aminopeptidase FrvX [Lentimonas sp.]|jgi:putative aminopeptidase FrvX